MKILKKSSERTVDGKKVPLKWIILLCHGGKFIIQAYEDLKLVHTCSDSKYVIRGKSGGRQANTDKRKNVMTSVGSQMRRENEKVLQEHIDEFMEDSKDLIEESHVIFLHAPGANKLIFLSEDRPLHQHIRKVKSIQFANKKANHSEAVELVKRLSEIKIIFNLN